MSDVVVTGIIHIIQNIHLSINDSQQLMIANLARFYDVVTVQERYAGFGSGLSSSSDYLHPVPQSPFHPPLYQCETIDGIIKPQLYNPHPSNNSLPPSPSPVTLPVLPYPHRSDLSYNSEDSIRTRGALQIIFIDAVFSCSTIHRSSSDHLSIILWASPFILTYTIYLTYKLRF